MSINFNAYGIKSSDMNIADLKPGQKLIRVNRSQVRFDNMKQITTSEYVIEKVLKTRLVVKPVDGNQTLRLLVGQESWKPEFRRGFVTADIEGNSQSWNRTAYEFATEDEADLIAQLVEARAAQIKEMEDRNQVKNAIAEVRHELDGNGDLAKVEAAIQALQVIADQLRAKQA